jgi:chromosomal replication initiation ATPase DnaA
MMTRELREAIDKIAEYLRENNLEQIVIGKNGGAAFRMSNIYEEILKYETNQSNDETPLGEVARYYSLQPSEILGVSRQQPAARARQVYMLILNKAMGWNKSRIGRHLRRDHSTVVHGIQKVESSREMKAEAEAIMKNFERERAIEQKSSRVLPFESSGCESSARLR